MIADRLWKRVVKTDTCWLWTGYKQKGYGRMSKDYPYTGALGVLTHRVSWELANGPIPEGLCVLHKCDNPSCVNPDHLFLGTRIDNSNDKVSKGRHVRGEKIARSKLTEPDVLAIRASKERAVVLAARYGIDRRIISYIKTRATWKHI